MLEAREMRSSKVSEWGRELGAEDLTGNEEEGEDVEVGAALLFALDIAALST